MGTLREDILDELWIWQIILADKVKLEAVNKGEVTLDQLWKLFNLMQWYAANSKGA